MKAPPLDGEGLGWGGLSGKVAHFIDSTPTQPSPIEGEDFARCVLSILAAVPDPEIPVVSVVDLGIVRGVRSDPPAVIITPTYTGCPATQVIEQSVREALDAAGLYHVAVETILSPPWTTDWITEVGRARLEAYGIAPPSAAVTPDCPQCGSAETTEVSRFGSTPCKSLWRCNACLEPFDRFKCH